MTKISRGGYGQQGYCKLCSFKDPDMQYDFDKRVGAGWSPQKLNVWLEEREEKRVDRSTIYRHRKHVANPKDRMVQAVKKRAVEQGFQPARVSEEEYLESIIAAAQTKVLQDPEAVTIDQGLKAAQIRSNMKSKGMDMAAIVAIFTNARPDTDTIEGEAREIRWLPESTSTER